MGQFKMLAGDFDLHRPGSVYFGRLSVPVKNKAFKSEDISRDQVESCDVATEEKLKKAGGAIGWGLAGGLALGPVGALAGLLVGGRKKEVVFVCKLKDGRRFLAKTDAKTFTAVQAALF